MRILTKYILKNHWKILVLITLFMFITVGNQLELISVFPSLLKLIRESNFNGMISLLGYIIFILVMLVFSSLVISYLSVRFTSNFAFNIRRKMYDIYMDCETFDDFNRFAVSGLMTRTVRGVSTLQTFLLLFIKKILLLFAISFCILLLTSFIDLRLTLILTVLMAVFLIVYVYKLNTLAESYYSIKKLNGKINKKFRSKIRGIDNFKLFTRNKWGNRLFGKVTHTSFDRGYHFQYRLNFSMLLLAVINVVIILVLFWYVSLVTYTEVKAIEFYYILLYVVFFMTSLNGITSFVNIYHMAYTTATRIEEVLMMKKEKREPVEVDSFSEILFDNVSLSVEDKNIVDNLSFRIRDNTTTLITGPSSAGKSSIIYMLMGFYTEYSGKITVDERNIDDCNMRKLINYCPIESYMINDTLLENIRLGDDSVTSDEVLDACRDVLMDISEENLDNLIYEDGSNLTGDQEQKISLARCLVKSAKIYVFDTSFSNIDGKSRHIIMDNIRKRLDNKTLIFIDSSADDYAFVDNIIHLKDDEKHPQKK